jgi:large subunit ribosomal protein L7/L12
MSNNLEKLVESLSALSVLEASQLSKMLEEHWGVSAAAPVAAAPVAAAPVAAAAQKSSFDVVLVSFGDKKLDVIKEVKAITGLDLAASKALVESAPKPVKAGVAKDEAESIKSKLEAVGAKVELS